MINVENICLSYTKEYFSLYNISFKVAKGECVALLGEKESGKSSLLRVIAGLEKATSGSVFIDKRLVEKINFKDDVKMGYLSEKGIFFENKTVFDNLAYVLKIRKTPKELIDSKVNTALYKYDIADIKNTKVNNLNMYDSIKVGLARLSLRPIDLFLIDDIYCNMEETEVGILKNMVKDLVNMNNATCLMAVSDKNIAKSFDAKIIKMNYGSLVE